MTGGGDPYRANLLTVRGLGGFVRALLPVRLTQGWSVTFVLWVAADREAVLNATEIWNTPEYARFEIEGRVANDVRPWDLLDAPVTVRTVDENELPHCVAGHEPRLTGVLQGVWDRELILSGLEPPAGRWADG